MSSPYFPPPPHSTPQHYALSTPRPPRQPVVNPYEKFTQADFDHWIGGITGALRRALGHEPDEPESVATVFEHHENGNQETPDDDEYTSEGDGVNDSLADIRARYVSRLDKGKARDPMEGPGLSTWGKGNKGTPIEIDFDEDGSPDEDALDDEEVIQHLSFVHDSDEEEQEDAEEQLPDQWLLPQSSLRTRTDDASDQEAGEEDDESASSDGDERLGSDDVIEVLSSDEEPGEAQKIASEDEQGSSEDEDLSESAEEGSENAERDEEEGVDAYFPASGSTHPNGVILADDEDDELEESRSVDEEEDHEEEGGDEEGSDEAEEEYDEPRPSKRDGDQSPREIITLDSDEEEDQLDDEADVIQPPDRDTAFPPHSSDTQTRIEIRDPWLGPQTYAEDFYSGGPILPSPGAALTPHHLGANDDADFLTPGVVTPAESNERETLADEQDDPVLHMPHLEFVHGHGAEEEGTEAVAAYDVTMESEKDDHVSRTSLPPIERDAEIADVMPAVAEEAVNQDDFQQQDYPTIAPVSEDNAKVSQPPQDDVHDGQEEARQAEDELDRAYEEMDAEVERESHAEDSLRQFEQQDEPSLQPPMGLGSSTVTVEEVPDEEASDKEEGLSSSPAVVPLGTSDLDVDIEPMLSDEQDESHPEDMFSHLLEAEGQVGSEVVVHAEDEPAAGTEEHVALEVTEKEEAEFGQLLDVIEQEALGSPVPEPAADDPSLLVGLEEFPDDAAAQTSVFPPADFVDNAVELELEQQQLPTPPAEQAFLHRSPIRHPSPGPEALLDTTATEYDHLLTAEDEVNTEQTTAASSALDQEISEAQAKPPFEEGADEIGSTEDITHHASLFEEGADEVDAMDGITQQASLFEAAADKIDSTEDIMHQASLFEEATDKIDSTEDITYQAPLFEDAADEIDSTEDIMHQESLGHETSSIIAGFDEEFPQPTSVPDAVGNDIAVQDVTDNSDALPDDWQGIVEEVASKAPSEEFWPHDEQESPGVYSKEGSIVSLSVTDGSNASGAMSYDVEVLMDEVTDDDADGEVDPDTSLNLTQDGTSSRELKDLAGEIFKDDWWTSDTCRKLSLEGDRIAHSAVKHDEYNLNQDERATAQGLHEEVDPHVTFTGQGGDEEDIASSREASPSPEAHLQPTRSPSPTVDPKELMTRTPESVATATPEDSPETEKELYGGAEENTQVQTRENTVENMASETLLAIETMTTPPEEASPTIPGLTLTASKRPPSPIPGLGAHLSGETVIEVAESEIPGLTWSKMVSSSAHVSYGSSSISGGPLRSPTFPQVTPSTPTTLSTSGAAFLVQRRSATEQGLFPDPYPYSLSTPGLDNVKDEGEDTDEDLEEQDMSMSSSSTTSTAEKDVVESLPENDKEGDNASERPSDHEAQEIHEPMDSNQVDLDATQDTAQLAGTDDVFTSGDADQDRDADGDLDPDFLQFPDNVADADKGVAPVEPTQEPLMSMESAVTPEVIEVSLDLDIKDFIESPDLSDEAINQQRSEADGSSPDANAETECTREMDTQGSDLAGMPESEEIPSVQNTDSRHSTPQPSVLDESNATTPTQMSPTIADEVSLDTVILPQDTTVALPEKPIQNGKRKRSSSPEPQHTTDRVDRQEENGASEDASRHRSPSPNGAKRARIDHAANGKHHISYLTDQSSLSSDEDDNSDTNSTGRMLRTDSASPKSSATAPAVAVEPFYPMLHRHGSGAKKQLYQDRIISQRHAQKAQSGPSMARPSLPASTSRTTRSNCRYRKISVPKEDDGPRVCFLVPGCSLGDEEVIEENEIEDLGEASYADSLRMIGDIESLDFDLYLIGVLRQLVGVDLLREQEVFYLPAPGEEPIRKSQLKKTGSDKSASGKKSSKSGNLETSSILDTPRPSIASLKAPSSKAGSVSTTASRPTRERGSSTPPSSLHSDLSSDEGEEPENSESKAARGKIDKGKTLATAADRSGRGGKQVKRTRRLAGDALAYKPVSDSDGELSDDNTSQSRHRSIRTTSRGSLKRTHSGRTFAGPEGSDGRDAKRHKRDR